MAEATTVSQRDWHRWMDWPFTQIFRSFRMAIHPSKLLLALIGVVLTVLCALLLDAIWPQRSKPIADELDAYWQVRDFDAWREAMPMVQAATLQRIYAEMNAEIPDNLGERLRDNPGQEIDRARRELRERYAAATRKTDDVDTARIADRYNAMSRDLNGLRRRSIFLSYIRFQGDVLRQMVSAAGSLNFTGRLDEVLIGRRRALQEQPVNENIGGIGVITGLVLMGRAAQWIISQHPIYTMLLGVGVLLLWALIGGAIARMAALEVARDERITIGNAVNFARRKYLSFLTAPLLAVGIIVLVGFCIFVFGVLMSIPYIGELFGSVLLFLPLLGGFVLALALIGAAAGKPLFYPTIAVEGSDSFDAISRSYSYIYSRPWRAIWYGLLAFVYGALCYLFVRFFALLMLKAARFCLKLGMLWTERPGTGRSWANKIDAMWPNPAYNDFWPGRAPFGTIHWETLGSWIIWLWVMLVAMLVAAFAISFFYSAATVIYYLMRRAVDATDMEEVYVEEEDEAEALASAPSGAAGDAGAAGTAPEEPPSPPPPSAEAGGAPSAEQPPP